MPHPLRIAAILVWLVVAAAPAPAQETRRPEQVLYLPLPLDPDPVGGRMPVSVAFHDFELPDARRAQLVRVEWWTRLSAIHSVRLAVDYAGLEGEGRFRYGGGRGEAQWSARYAEAWPAPLALDLAVTAPLGDATLHPLSAKAPALRGRLRVRPVAVGTARLWLGVGGRMVSPPGDDDVRDVPLEAFPSGAFVDAAVRIGGSRWRGSVAARHGLGGLPGETTLVAGVERTFTEDLALRLGGGVSIGPARDRLFDRALDVALVWSPRTTTTEGRDRDSRR